MLKKRSFLVSFVLLLCSVLFAFCLAGGVVSAFASGSENSFTTDKTSYVEGEAIMVTVTGTETTGKPEWLGIYPSTVEWVGGQPNMSSIRWRRVFSDGYESGVAYDMRLAPNIQTESLKDIPAGTYSIVLMLNDYTLVQRTEITVVAETENSFTTDKTSYVEGEAIMVTVTGTETTGNREWLGIYPSTVEWVGGRPNMSSIRWRRVFSDGYESGVAYDMRLAPNIQTESLKDIPAGTYSIVLMLDDYTLVQRTEITVVAEPPEAPVSAIYTATENLPAYRADGTVTVTANDGDIPAYYRVMWGNGDGVLDGYNAFQDVVASGVSTEITIPSYTIVPENADRLLVYSVESNTASLTYATAQLTNKSSVTGQILSEFQIASDTHVKSNTADEHNTRFANFLAQVNSISPNTSAIFIDGDVVDGDNVDYENSFAVQYENFIALADTANLTSKIYPIMGNHEYFGWGSLGVSATRDENCINQFKTGLAATALGDDLYYYVDMNGSRFIMLSGLECHNDNYAYLGETQRAWFADALATAPEGQIFVFLHQGLSNTVAGTVTFSGVSTQDEAFIRTELAKYPRAIYFSGHTHEQMTSVGNLYVANGLTAINTSSVAYTYNESQSARVGGSEAYFVYLYEDKVVIKGRDLINQAWIPEAQYVIERPAEHQHSLTHVEAAAATDAADGNIEYWYCADCNKYFSDAAATDEITLTQTVIAKHKLQHVEAVAPTDKADGNIEYWYCATCNKYYSNQIGTAEITQAQTVIAKHTLQHVEAVAATETADGNIEYWYCAECDKYYFDADATTEITKADTVVTYEAGGCGSTLTGGSIFGSVMVVAVIVLAVIVLRKKRC